MEFNSLYDIKPMYDTELKQILKEPVCEIY